MPVPRPELDDVRYADLVAQALAYLPAATPEWTDFNPSDPGVTFTELLAYVCDGLGYTVSRFEGGMDAKYAALLGEAAGPQVPAPDALARAVRRLAQVERAVTATDVASVVLDSILVLDLPVTGDHMGATDVQLMPFPTTPWRLRAGAPTGTDVVVLDGPGPHPGDVVILEGRGSSPSEAATVTEVRATERGTEVRLAGPLRRDRAETTRVGLADRATTTGTTLDARASTGERTLRLAPASLPVRAVLSLGGSEWAVGTRLGRVGVVARATGPRPGVDVLVRPVGSGQPDAALCQSVYDLLRHRGVIGTRFAVGGPQYVSVDIDVRVVRDPLGLQRTDTLRQAVADAVRAYLDPLVGGRDGAGWPFGSPIYRSALNRVVERVPGVDHVHRIAVSGDDTSDSWPLAKDRADAARRLVSLQEVRVTALDSVEGW